MTWGDELENKLEERFSTLVANHYQADYENISDCGRSNDAITRTTMQWFANGNKTDLAIIQWSVISRLEGYDDLNKRYINITVDTKTKWQEFYRKYYHNQLGVDTLFKNYYLLENFFIQNNIPYLFLIHDCWDNTVKNTNSVWKDFIIKKDFHILRDNLRDNLCDKENILDVDIHIRPNKGHPNPLGHRTIADYVIDTIGTL